MTVYGVFVRGDDRDFVLDSLYQSEAAANCRCQMLLRTDDAYVEELEVFGDDD